MKNLMHIFLLSISINLFAQPGDIAGMHQRRFEEITKELKKSPNNYKLIWKRLHIVFHPHFDIYAKPNVQFYDPAIHHSKQEFLTFTHEEILSDLNKLIDNNAEINEYGRISNITDFIFLRGKLYYISGNYEKALADYLFALNKIDNNTEKLNKDSKKEEVCIALAAYYYNLDDRDKNYSNQHVLESNLRQALKYIDMVSPIEFTDNFNDEKENSSYEIIRDPFERDKLNLLNYLKEDARLEKYYKKLMRNQYEVFKKEKIHDDEWSKEETEKNGYSYTTNESYLHVLEYANDLANFYYEKKNYKKAKWLTEQIINYYPANNSGYIVDRYAVGKHYLLLNRIYHTEGIQNFDMEMNSLIELLGGSTHGINYKVPELGIYIKERIELYPNEPRLYLALTIWNYKNSLDSYNPAELPSDEIINLINKAEQMNFKDYRLYYAKSLIYLHLQKNYELALTEINKALKICQFNPFVYSTKYEILRKFSNPNEQELQILQEESKKKWKTKDYKNLNNLFNELK